MFAASRTARQRGVRPVCDALEGRALLSSMMVPPMGGRERAAEFDWKATISRGMASIHARSILVERAGVGLR